MSDKSSISSPSAHESDDVGRLVRYAGAREDVAEARAANAHARVLEHWEQETAARKRVTRRQRGTWYAAAAGIALVAISALWLLSTLTRPGGVPFAIVVSTSGDAYLGDTPLVPGERINAAASVHTLTGGHVVLAMESGHELRLDENTKLEARDDNRFGLERGAVFVRSGAGRETSVFIETPFGTASDLGTQFQVRLARRSIVVSVREGLVQLEKSRSDRVNIEDGNLYVLSDDGLSQFRQVAADDEIWDWVDASPPAFDIEGVSLASYLAWFASEIGAELEWADAASQAAAGATVLSGSIEGATLKEGFEEVRSFAPFEYEMTKSTLRVKVL